MPTRSKRQSEYVLSKEARALAEAIRAVRPEVMPGTNTILKESERKAFYNLVNEAADLLWPLESCSDPRASWTFFNICGIPD